MIWARRETRGLVGGLLVVLCVTALVERTWAQTIGTWCPTGSLSVARANFPELLVPLADGRILAIAGVDAEFNPLASTEVYNPSTGTWSLTGSLGTARFANTATRLLDGRVLVAGGNPGTTNETNSAELYDPVAGAWTPTGSLATARQRHTATLLSDGRVLIAGGQGVAGLLNSAEIYDPATGTFSPTGSMASVRQEFTSTLLPSGKVLIVGGQISASVTAAGELYDPATGTFTPTGSMGTPRSQHTATLLPNGKVLIVGGTTTAPGPSTPTATAELYDLTTGTFSPTGSLTNPRLQHTATLMQDGNVLIAGGLGSGNVVLSSVEIYDPSNGTFSAAANMGVARRVHGAALLETGQVLVAGGATPGGGRTSSAELFPCVVAVPIVIDEDSIDNGTPPNFFSAVDVNDDIAEIGLRAQLPFFTANVGATITLHTGQVGDEGWFALKTIPAKWAAAGPTPDGLKNYLAAGPGLGTPDAKGDREALLDKVPDVTPLRATGLNLLKGKQVCAVVYDSDISINYGPLNGSLKGANLGTVAFEVLNVTALTGFSSSSLPEVTIKILDAGKVCQGSLTLFTDAPAPISSSEPFDVVP